jgi:putative DNA primase/helicase
MSDEDRRTINDEFGELVQRRTSQNKWTNESRTYNGVTFYLDSTRKTVDFLLALKAAGVRLKLNVMNDRIEVSGNLEYLPEQYEPLSDIHSSVIVNWLFDAGLRGENHMARAINEAAARKAYHPVKEYLMGLEWDGKDHFTGLLEHIDFKENTREHGTLFLRRWLIGSIAKVIEQGQNFMLVLDGPQGIGKSYFSRWICPLPALFIESPIHTEDKDSYKRLISNLIWEVGELEGVTRKADRAALKDFITRREVTIRVPYGRHDITKPAAASLIGTINNDGVGFLNDPTGNRRYAVVQVEHFDFAYSKKINCSQLWAQINSWYLSGEAWELKQDERLLQDIVNEDYDAVSPVVEFLYSNYDLSKSGNSFVPTIEILTNLRELGLGGNDRAAMMEISSQLTKVGIKKGRQNNLRGFYLWEKNRLQ